MEAYRHRSAEGEHECHVSVDNRAVQQSASTAATRLLPRKHCVTPETYAKRLARKEGFAEEVLAFILRNINGISIDREYHMETTRAVWGLIIRGSTACAHGRLCSVVWSRVMLSGDADAEGLLSYLPFATKLLNMGSYEVT